MVHEKNEEKRGAARQEIVCSEGTRDKSASEAFR